MADFYGPQRESDLGADVDLRDLEEALRRIELAGYDLRPVFIRSRRAMRQDIKAHRKAQASPEGRWAPLSPLTIAKRRARKGKQGRKRRRPPKPIGKLLGRLPGAFNIVIGAHTMRAISRVKWSGAQNEGDKVGKRARIPSREFMWVSRAMVASVATVASDFMIGAWEGRRR